MMAEPILDAAEMRAAEQALFASGVPEYDVMVRAGRAAAEIIWRTGAHRDTLILCGPGNNGGDGYVIARALREHGVPVRVAALAEPVTESAKQARADWDGPVEDLMTATPAHQVVDALFGTGLSRGLELSVASRLADLVEAAGHSYAVDLPSGISTDDGALLSPVPHFDICISLGAWKRAHMLRPAATCWDRMVCCDIGIDAPGAAVRRIARPFLSAPDDGAHKYTRGLVAAVAGEMAGASALGAEAAARSGAGYVKLLGAQAIVDTSHAIVRGSLKDETELADKRIDALLVGPGLGRSDAAAERLGQVLVHRHPAVLDADALWHLSHGALAALPDKAILTPHAGEFAQLFANLKGLDIAGTVIEQALSAAKGSGAVVVLKGPTTVVAAPDGRACVSDRASSWLSTAGTGDVLAGICAARLAVTGDPYGAACEAVWLHREAARMAGPGFIADDLLPHLPGVLGRCL
ncbi:MAG: NAD(P)H-hydrate dehydratase [Sphingobium sp.]